MSVVTSVSQTHSGPAWILAGDFTQAAAAGVKEVGLVLNASVKLKVWRQTTKNELGQILPDGIYGVVQGATVVLSMMKNSALILASLVNELSDETSWIGADTELGTRTPFSLAVVPDHVKTAQDAETNLAVQWLPKVFTQDIAEFIHRLEKAGTDDDSNPFNVTLEAALAPTDQADAEIDPKGQIWWRGAPSGPVGVVSPALPWNVPAAYQS